MRTPNLGQNEYNSHTPTTILQLITITLPPNLIIHCPLINLVLNETFLTENTQLEMHNTNEKLVKPTKPRLISYQNKKTSTYRERERNKRLPVSSFGVFTHGRDLKSGSQVHSFVSLLLLVRTTEESGDRSGLLCLLEAVHHSYRLPVEVILAFNRKQCVDPQFSFFLAPPVTDQTQQKYHQYR